jgi:L-lactate dehydrogenase complex protein LldF
MTNRELRTPWPERRARALADVTLRETLARVMPQIAAARVRAYAGDPTAEAARVRARDRRRATLADNGALLAQAMKTIESQGGRATVVADGAAAAQYILDVARRRQARLVVKSKSMVTEELDLNRRLEAGGLRVRETDLGEYIVQLAGEKPSHILAPAIHRNRVQVKDVFDAEARRAGVSPPASDDITALTRYARERLRNDFLTADIGITGANFVVAETGTVVLITNEGNADMVTTLPPVHIAVVGIEKLVARFDDLADLLPQPAMNGVGLRLSAYTTFISGPRMPGQLEGPEEWHVLFVDNGRRSILESPFAEVLTCIRCGACYNVCPVFRQVGGHAYGSVYGGPIGVALTPLLLGLENAADLPDNLCTLCHACVEACPMDIDLPAYFVELRQRLVTRRLKPVSVRATYHQWSRLWATPGGYRRSVRMARLAQRLYTHRGRLVAGPGLLGGWTKTRDMPPVASQTFLEWWGTRQQQQKEGARRD